MATPLRSSPSKASSGATARRRKHVSEEVFGAADFALRDFVEGLSRRAVLEGERGGGSEALETEAVRGLCEGALTELSALDAALSRRLSEALDKCAKAEGRCQRETEQLVRSEGMLHSVASALVLCRLSGRRCCRAS